MSNFGVANGGLAFSATPQVTLLNGPATSIPTAPLQRVEIFMSSDTAGAAKVFWAPAPSGSDNGFQPGDENDFVLVGDGVFHHYYLPIDTSSATTIYGLRLMVPPGATVTIQTFSVANLIAPSGSGVSPLWQFNVDGNALGWIPYEGAVDMNVSGGRLRISAYSNATILGPKAQVTNQLEWFTLLGSVSQSSLDAPWIQFNYLSTANHGISTSVYFPVVADLADRVYNQNVGGASGWDAGVSQLSISIPENTKLAISQIQVSAAPQGLADLALDSCGPASPVVRAGPQFQISCRVSNRGSQPVQQVSVNLIVPSGVTVISRAAISGSLTSGYPQTLVWTLVSSWTGNLKFSVSLASPTGESAQATATILVTPSVQTQNSPYVPLPVPVSSNYDVGVYYFPGWQLHSHWDPIRAFPERMPLLGNYAEGDPQVVDWQIKWAVEHGVKFFAADWSWYGPGMPTTEQGEQPNSFLQAYASSVYHGYIQFCLSYAGNQPAAIAGSVPELLTITQTWIDKYFPRSEYYRIGRMPVIIVRNPDILAANLGGSAKQGLDAARQLAKAAGFNGIYFIAATSDVAQPSQIQVSQLLADGYDALSGYSSSRAGTFNPDESPYSLEVSGLPSLWDAYIAASTIPYIVPASPGFDLRPWASYTAPNELVRTGSTATQFEQMLQQARSRIDAGKAPRVVLIEAWNQFGEGSYVEPTVGRGFSYLDAIRNAFAGNTPHTDLAPGDVGLPLITTSPSAALWTFTDPSDLTPWQAAPGLPLYNWARNISNSKIANKQWTFTTNGNADLARMGFELSAQNYQGVAIRMSVSADTNVNVYWGAADEPGLSVLRNMGFTAKAGPMQTYNLTLNNNPGWRGIINLLRLTTSNSANVDVAIESIEFLSSSPGAAIAVSKMQSQFDWNVGAPLPAPQTISIASATGSSLSWTATTNSSWLTVSPAAGTGGTSLTLSVNPERARDWRVRGRGHDFLARSLERSANHSRHFVGNASSARL